MMNSPQTLSISTPISKRDISFWQLRWQTFTIPAARWSFKLASYRFFANWSPSKFSSQPESNQASINHVLRLWIILCSTISMKSRTQRREPSWTVTMNWPYWTVRHSTRLAYSINSKWLWEPRENKRLRKRWRICSKTSPHASNP